MPCMKKHYSSRNDAHHAAGRAGKLNYYKCPLCDGWHLTSMTKRELRQARKEFRERAKLTTEQAVHERYLAERRHEEKQRRIMAQRTGG